MAESFFVRIHEDVPSTKCVYSYRGQTLEVTETDDGTYYRVVHPTAIHNWNFTIRKEHATRVPAPTILPKSEEFQLKSGMTFKTNRDETGLIVATDGGLVAMFHRNGKYETYATDPEKYFGDVYGTEFTEIYEGVNHYPGAGLTNEIPKTNKQGKIVWSKINRDVKLNGEYTAKVFKNSVTVGCQEIPMNAIREILTIADKL
jgi:hypothetical protein